MITKKALCTAIGAALATASGTTLAQGDFSDWLVPYVVKDANRTTVVTVIGDGAPKSNADTLHLQYWTKSTTDANTAACQPSSVYVPFTDNDIMTFDTAGILGYPLFGDSTNPAALGASISYAAPRHGYLVALNTVGEPFFAIYWVELDLANGGAHGDQAFSSGAGGTDFANWLDPHVVLRNARAVAFWPSSVATTTFTVTPLGTAMDTKENNQVTLQVFNADDVQGAYDRNENGVDGTVPVTVRCVGRVTPQQLMPGVFANAAWAAQGGWGALETADPDSSIVYQVDTSNAGGKFVSNATRITDGRGAYIGDSDVRLKRDIKRIGATEHGFGLYTFRYLWDDRLRVGVMAQEVIRTRPDAVLTGADGYFLVDYGRLGLSHLLH